MAIKVKFIYIHIMIKKMCYFYPSSGIIVPGGFGQRGMEGKVAVCKWSRTNKIPMLGVCLGLQAAVIEFARFDICFIVLCYAEYYII